MSFKDKRIAVIGGGLGGMLASLGLVSSSKGKGKRPHQQLVLDPFAGHAISIYPGNAMDLYDKVQAVVERAGTSAGLAHVFVHHTSASLTITENADPDVLRDLEAWISRAVRDGERANTGTRCRVAARVRRQAVDNARMACTG